MITKRSAPLCIVFSLITCGIYNIYWFVVTTNAIQASLRNPDGSVSSGGMTLLLSIVTCGIYYFYWWYKQGQRCAQLQQENGIPPVNNSALYLVLNFFAIGLFINIALLQSELNKVADVQALRIRNDNAPVSGGAYNGYNPNNNDDNRG